jgi:hypothetical protein
MTHPRDGTAEDADDVAVRSKRQASPTPHPGEPDVRPTSVLRDPDDEDVQEGNSSPRAGP